MQEKVLNSIPSFSKHSASRFCRFSRTGNVTLIIIVLILFLSQYHHSFIPSSRKTVLRPGDFFDAIRYGTPAEKPPPDEPPPDEPAGEATLHDIRNVNFYLGGTRSLTTTPKNGKQVAPHPKPLIYDPYPRHRDWTGGGSFKTCKGPRGRDLDRSNPEDMMHVYRGNQKKFPFQTFGSYEALGLDGNVCTDRYARFGTYGYGQDEEEAVPGFTKPKKVDWDRVDWGTLQTDCLHRNSARFKPKQADQSIPPHPFSLAGSESASSPKGSGHSSLNGYKPRSAVVLRTVHHFNWTPSHRQYLRSLIMELSLHSGAEYDIFLLVDVKDIGLPIYSDPGTVEQLKWNHVPPEFHNITVFFNNRLLEAWYPRVPEHEAKFQHLQALQIFSQSYPDYDYYWQLEMDARQTGHMYHFLEKAIEFAKQQPRRYLWERNSYFYTPGAHGSWKEFMQMVDKNMAGKSSVWGPLPAEGVQPTGPRPPVARPEDDDYKWGVGEEADFITFLPMFDPTNTSWTFPNQIYAFPQGTQTPRRASPITMSRISKRLLNLIHQDQAAHGLGLASEMTAPSWALYHGFKAVSIPQPIYADGQWTPHEAARIFNKGPTDKVNAGTDSLWNFDHKLDRFIYRLTYMFVTQTAEDLFRQWLGYGADPNRYNDGQDHRDEQGLEWYDGGGLNEAAYGRLCFPPIFLHTVKNVEPKKSWLPAVQLTTK